MDIWILVLALLVIAIVLLIASFYAKEDTKLEENIEELRIQQSEALLDINNRLNEVEHTLQDPASYLLSSEPSDNYPEAQEVLEEIELAEISDLTKEEVIRLYSQGFTMQEIARDVALNVNTVQLIVDDYIENR
ncbi:TPA: helix-turn-helix domain-containing protein [Streptococcus suis]